MTTQQADRIAALCEQMKLARLRTQWSALAPAGDDAGGQDTGATGSRTIATRGSNEEDTGGGMTRAALLCRDGVRPSRPSRACDSARWVGFTSATKRKVGQIYIGADSPQALAGVQTHGARSRRTCVGLRTHGPR